MNLNGIPIIADPLMGKWVQIKFPRSKKKRIRRKWAKSHKNYAWVNSGRIYQINGVLYMHPTMLNELKKKVNSDK